MRDCHSIVGLYTYQNRVPFAPSLRWVSCKERDRLPHEGANFHSSFVHYPDFVHTCECVTQAEFLRFAAITQQTGNPGLIHQIEFGHHTFSSVSLLMTIPRSG